MLTSALGLFSFLNEPSRVNRIVRGRVHVHFKDIGLYLVAPLETNVAVTGLVEAVDLSASSHNGVGVVTESGVITVGTVVFMLMDNSPVKSPESRSTDVAVIIGTENVLGKKDTKLHPMWSLTAQQDASNLDFLPGITDPVRTAIIETSGITKTGDRSAGRPLDMCDGDWITFNPLKGYISVTRDRVSMAGGPMTGLHLFSGHDTCIFNTGSRFIQDGASSRRTVYADNDGFTDVDNLALTVGASLGAFKETTEAIAVESPYTVVDPLAFPVWRHQSIKGQLVSGHIEAINVPKEEAGLNTADSKPQYSVVSEYSGYDGVRSTTAAHSASLARDIRIPALNQLEDEVFKDGPSPEAEDTFDDVFSKLSGEDLEYSTQYADLMYELMKRKFIERYMPRAKARDKNWKALTAKEICDEVFQKDSEDPPLKNMEEDLPCYKLSDNDLVEHTGFVKDGEKLKSSLSSNYFHLSPSGAVIVSDGFGSEIRLEGGNITITCPGDLKLLPGRDLIGLVPRDTSIFTQGRVDLASDKSEVAIKAKKGVSVVAVDGPAVLESQKVARSAAEDMDARKDGKASGVVIRSATTAAIIGQNVRVGLQAQKDKRTRGRADHAGALVLDAGTGSAVLSGSSVYVAGKEHASLTTKNAGLSATGATLGIGGSITTISSSVLKIGGAPLALERPDITPGGIKPKPVKAGGTGTAYVSIKGDLFVKKSFGARTIIASVVRATTMAANNGSDFSGIKAEGAVQPIWNTHGKGVESGDVSAHQDGSKQGAEDIQMRSDEDKLFSAAGTLAAGLYYPTSEKCHCGTQYFLTQSRWQRKLKEGGGGHKWTPEPVKNLLSGDKGLPKPGLEAFTENEIIRVVEIKEDALEIKPTQFSGNYPVNATVK